MATAMLTAEKPAYEAALRAFLDGRKRVQLAAVHRRVERLITDPALSFAWMLSHFGEGSASGWYGDRRGELRAASQKYGAYYTAPASWTSYKRDRSDVAADRGPEAPAANLSAIQSSVDMTLGAQADRYLRGWLSYAQGIDRKYLKMEWPQHTYQVVDGQGRSVAVKQSAAYHAMVTISADVSTGMVSNLQQVAQRFYDEVHRAAPSWDIVALDLIQRSGAPPPRVAIGGGRNLSDAVKGAYETLRDRAAGTRDIAAKPQPTKTAGGSGTTAAGGTMVAGQSATSNLWLYLGIAAAAAALLLFAADGSAA